MSRGNDGQDIYLNDDDRKLFLETISEMSERFKIFKEKMINDKKVKTQFEKLNSQFKLWHLCCEFFQPIEITKFKVRIVAIAYFYT